VNITVAEYGELFKELCHLAAFADDRKYDTAISGMLRRILMYPAVAISSPSAFRAEILTRFHIDIEEWVIEQALDAETESGHIVYSISEGRYDLSDEARTETHDRISRSDDLGDAVRREWMEGMSDLVSGAADELWNVLHEYMVRAFRRHGMLSLRLLKSEAAATDAQEQESLNSMLSEAVRRHAIKVDPNRAESEVSQFFKRTTPNRTRYIAQILDLTFGLFALSVTPLAAGYLRNNLKNLAILLDTNVIFGLLDLHQHPLNDISKSLVKTIRRSGLPVKMYYHEETLREFQGYIRTARSGLANARWSPAISRAALAEDVGVNLSVLERKYHEANSKSATDVGVFLSLYSRIESLLASLGLEKYPFPAFDAKREAKAQECIRLYEEYITHSSKERTVSAIEHDMRVWVSVSVIHDGASKSFLDAQALFLTNDYTLYRFDRRMLNSEGDLGIVVLPQHLTQILRFFVNPSPEMDADLVKAFAIPEFNSIGNPDDDSTKRKILTFVNQYKGMPTDTAIHILADTVLNATLQDIEADSDIFKEVIDNALIQHNKELEAETAAALQQSRVAEHRRSELEARLAAEESRNQAAVIQIAETNAAAELAERTALDHATKLEVERQSAQVARDEHDRTIAAQQAEIKRLEVAEQSRHDRDARRRLTMSIVARVVLLLATWVIPWHFRQQINASAHRLNIWIETSLIFGTLVGLAFDVKHRREWLLGGILVAAIGLVAVL
jgi:hypothetical protein